jgi:uncharacterized protein
MRFPIDAVWVDRELNVVGITPEIPAWRTARCKGAKGVVELPAGEAGRRSIRTGDRLVLKPQPEPVPAARAA